MNYLKHAKRIEVNLPDEKYNNPRTWEREVYNTAIGIDLVKLNVSIKRVDWKVLQGIMNSAGEKLDVLSPFKKDHIYCLASFSKTHFLNIPGNEKEERRYSSIIIKYPYYSLTLKSSGNGRRDVIQLTIRVVPQNKDLGNINNFTAAELKKNTRERIKDIEEFGIYLYKNKRIIIEYIEINRNFISGKDNFLDFFCAAFPALPESFRNKPLYEQEGKIGLESDELIGIKSFSSTIGLHVYNKSYETEETKKYIIIKNVDKESIYRVEFSVKRPDRVRSWLGTNNLFAISQKNITDAYNNYLNTYIFQKFDITYNKVWNKMVKTGPVYHKGTNLNGVVLEEDIKENILDTSKKNWTDKFARELLYWADKYHLSLRFFTKKDIEDILKESVTSSNTIKQNMSRCVKQIVEKSVGGIDPIKKKINGRIKTEKSDVQIMKELLLSKAQEFVVEYYNIQREN